MLAVAQNLENIANLDVILGIIGALILWNNDTLKITRAICLDGVECYDDNV